MVGSQKRGDNRKDIRYDGGLDRKQDNIGALDGGDGGRGGGRATPNSSATAWALAV